MDNIVGNNVDNPRHKARVSWGDAQNLHTDIKAKLSGLKKERGNANTTACFEEVEQMMAK